MSLKESLDLLAHSFVENILAEAIRSTVADFAELPAGHTLTLPSYRSGVLPVSAATLKALKVSPPSKKSGRLPRRTPAQIVEGVNAIVALLREHSDGMRSEQIRAALGLDVRELPSLLKQGVKATMLRIVSGQKRSTVYGVGEGAGGWKRPVKAKVAKKPTKAKPVKSAKKKVAKKVAKKPTAKKTKRAAAKVSKRAPARAKKSATVPAEE